MTVIAFPTATAGQRPDAALARTMGELRVLQRQLETTRRDHLQFVPAEAPLCDTRIGNVCYWLPRGDPPRLKPDAPPVTRARRTLVNRLRAAVDRFPGSRWIRGQLVRYEVERDRFAAALSAATACPDSIAGWCDALAGYTHHFAGRFDLAEAAFDAALADMEPEQRCSWTDLTWLLVGEPRDAYRDETCDTRDSLQARILWLADPLYSTPGNEVRSDHFSRQVWSAMLRDSRSVDRINWTRSDHEGVVRFGVMIAWARNRTYRTTPTDNIVGYHEHDSRFLFPVRLPAATASIDSDTWRLDIRRAPSWHAAAGGYAISDDLTYEIARFARPESDILVAMVTPPPDPNWADAVLHAVSTPGPGRMQRAASTSGTGGLRRAVLETGTTESLISLELIADTHETSRRARFGYRPFPRGEGPILSDIVVLETDQATPASLAQATERFLPDATAQPGTTVDLYWEVYLGSQSAVAHTELTVERTGRSFLRRFAEWTPFAGPERPTAHAWSEFLQAPSGVYRTTQSVVLPPNMNEGTYRITLTMRTDGVTQVRERTFSVRRQSPNR